MLYFNTKPNYKVLSKYYQLPQSPEQMQQDYNDGFPIVIDWYYTDEMVAHIDNEFKAILSKYNLSEHYDNLLYLTLSKLQYIENVISELLTQYTYKKKVKELASLLLTFKRTPAKQLNSLQLKTLTDTVKVNDADLITWIVTLIKQAIEQGQYPISLLGLEPEQWLDNTPSEKMLSDAKLRATAIMSLQSPTKAIKSYHANLCLSLYNYLTHETVIKPSSSVLFSDEMLLFYFDLLVLFELIDPDQIESDAKDYMSALLRNQIKRLNS